MKIKTTYLLTLFLGLFTVSSTAQNRWLPEDDYRVYQSQSRILGYEAHVQNPGDDTVVFLNYTQYREVTGLFLIDGETKNLYHYFKDSLSDMLPGKYVPSSERTNILTAGLWLKNNPLVSDTYLALDTDSSGNNWYIESELQWNYSADYQDSTLQMTFDIDDPQGDPANHPWNGKHLLFGKEKGLLEFPDEDGNTASLIYSEDFSFGEMPRNWSDIHDVEVGTEIHVITRELSPGEYDTTLSIHKVLSTTFQNDQWVRIDSVWETSYRYIEDSSQILGAKEIYRTFEGVDTLINSGLASGLVYHHAGVNGWSDSMNRFVEFQKQQSWDPNVPLYAAMETQADFNISPTPPYAYINYDQSPQDVERKGTVYYRGLGGPYRRYVSISGPTDDYVVYAKNSKMEWGEPLSKSEVLSAPEIRQEVEVTIYPNPASDQIHLSGLRGNFQYQVSNIQGQIVQSGKLRETDPSINISELTNGVYFLLIQSENQYSRAKFIVR